MATSIISNSDQRPTVTRIRLRIPKNYHQEPIISRLVSDYHLTVNIVSALLGANAQGDGWFDLELRGKATQIDSAIVYISELDLEILDQDGLSQDGW